MVKGSEGGTPRDPGPRRGQPLSAGPSFSTPAQPHHHSPRTALSLSLAAWFPVTTPSYPFQTRWVGADPRPQPPPSSCQQSPGNVHEVARLRLPIASTQAPF